MNVVILARKALMDKDEQSAMLDNWPGEIYHQRTRLPHNSLIIGRYSVLPYYEEVSADVAELGCHLANTPRQHAWIADIGQWYQDLADVTPTTYFGSWADLPATGSYVLKGRTNSRKWQWKTHMFAPTRLDVPEVYRRLIGDTFINDQGVVVRQYVPLNVLERGMNDVPFSNEWRLFYWGSRLVSSGYYWACADESVKPQTLPYAARQLGDRIAKRIADRGLATFFALDVAETAAGPWIVIEVNDGQMSGLSDIDAGAFYASLWRVTQHEMPGFSHETMLECDLCGSDQTVVAVDTCSCCGRLVCSDCEAAHTAQHSAGME